MKQTELKNVVGSYDAGLANFWFSHIPKAKIFEFLSTFHKKLKPGSVIFIADNVYVEGVGGELTRKKGSEDTFKIRKLEGGSTHTILKNYYTKKELEEIFSQVGINLNIHIGKCFWWINYKIE